MKYELLLDWFDLQNVFATKVLVKSSATSSGVMNYESLEDND